MMRRQALELVCALTVWLRFIFHVRINVPAACLKLLGRLMPFEEMYIFFYSIRNFMLMFLALNN